MLDPSTWKIIDWPADDPPRLVVVVDTEAEFNWARQQPRRAVGVTSVKRQLQTLPIFERYGVRPTFVLDYPVSSTPAGYEFIRELHRSGTCEIGAHLQPWDNPPFVEQITDENSYPGNLPFELEREKLVQLTRIISDNIGVRPRIYKAGRYGVGRATAQILAELGYEIDVSVVPGTDLRGEFGPDFSHCKARPYWFGGDPALLEIPLSIGYTGLLAPIGPTAHVLTMNERLKALHVPGILAHLGLIERIALTPEGISFAEQRRLTLALLRKGHRVFSLTYHSPSLAPGNTPYVRSEADLREFLQRIEQYLDFFTGELGGQAATPFEIKALAERCAPWRGADGRGADGRGAGGRGAGAAAGTTRHSEPGPEPGPARH
ncbi:MAG TPA: polysaccharide deacetylase family protein [Stellaceae bacterium]|nr:polysaccharide deacetylase family protein [Stellaceae bacterium]